MIDKPTSELAYRCADCGRTYFSSAPNLVERGKRCPRCNGVLRRRAGDDRWAPPSKA
jgi:DNA-directed RNA polymerase subunit RPC12/RpoP